MIAYISFCMKGKPMSEQEINEFLDRVTKAASVAQLHEGIGAINTAGFALAFMSAEPESISEIVLNLKVIVGALIGVP